MKTRREQKGRIDVEAGWLAMYTDELGYPHKTEFWGNSHSSHSRVRSYHEPIPIVIGLLSCFERNYSSIKSKMDGKNMPCCKKEGLQTPVSLEARQVNNNNNNKRNRPDERQKGMDWKLDNHANSPFSCVFFSIVLFYIFMKNNGWAGTHMLATFTIFDYSCFHT